MSKIANNSGWRAQGQAVLLLAIELAERRNMIAVPQTAAMSSAGADTEGLVVDIGPDCWKGRVGQNPNSPYETPRAKIGDRVLFTKYTGGVINGKDGQVYRMIPCHAIYAVAEEQDHAS